MCLNTAVSHRIYTAVITLIKAITRTAPAAQSFAFFAISFFSGLTRSTILSTAVFISSRASTAPIQRYKTALSPAVSS